MTKINLKYLYLIAGWLLIQSSTSFGNQKKISKSSNSPYVTCKLEGQLGNQLFQIATTLAYAWDHNFQALFPDLNRYDMGIPENREKIFFRLDNRRLPRPIQHVFKKCNLYNYVEIPLKDDLILHGLFQSSKYFHNHREKLLKLFAPSEKTYNALQKKFSEVLKHPNSVGVHVRTYNKAWHNKLPFVGLDYYAKAFDYFSQEALFVVFSDRINWCKHHFKKFNRSIIFMDSSNYVEEFFLMSMLKHNIIANSTFSWWAAYLNQNQNKVIIAPSLFHIKNGKPDYLTPSLPGWILIDINHQAPYPEDMYVYDEFSASIDTQND